MKGLLNKLLRANVSVPQMVGFALSNLIGLAIVMLALQFYFDVRQVFNNDDNSLNKDFLVLTKRVNSGISFLSSDTEISEQELADLKNQAWLKSMGKFTTSNYGVKATVGVGGYNLSTQLFFESIPNEFLDIKPNSWGFDEADPYIPIILSKDYLALYNFGFAASRGMPQISEGMVGSIPLMFEIHGDGNYKLLPGKVVGFSNRLNTILVPEEFMEWSNKRFARDEPSRVSRVIVEVKDPGNPQIQKYLEAHNYEVAGDKQDSNKANYLLTIVVSIVIIIGLLISTLSFFVLMLSIFLLLQKNAKKLQDLLMLGYSPQMVAKSYIKMVLYINIGVFIGAIALMIIFRMQYLPVLESLNVVTGNVSWSLILGFLLILGVTFINIHLINRKILSMWKG